MFTSKFSQIRNAMHTFSRAPLAKGQKWLDQSTAPAGHNISFEKVRAEAIPAIASISERDANYLEMKDDVRVVGGSYGKNYANVIKFIDRFSIVEIPNTNGESYVIVDDANNYQTDFIDPADKPINQYTLSEGYELIMYSEAGIPISKNVGWTFDSFNGIIHFEGKNPRSADWEYGAPTVEGFVYIGKKISSMLDNYEADLAAAKDTVKSVEDSALSIQPFKFSTTEMTMMGEPYPIENSNLPIPDYFQCLSIIIPGFVFELVSLDDDETVITDMRHLPTGDTQIFLNLPWHIEARCPIMRYDYTGGQDGIGSRIPVVGKYKFIAMAFVQKNGKKIPLKPLFDYEANPNTVIPVPYGYEISTPFEDGVQIPSLSMPPHPQHSTGYPRHFPYPPISDDDTIVNVYNS